MDKKEKYYNFIVDDLMGKVHVGSPHDAYAIYGVNDIYIDGVEIDYRGFASGTVFSIYHKFINDLKPYLIDKYGVHDEDHELNTIWFRLRNRVREELLRPSDDEDWWVND